MPPKSPARNGKGDERLDTDAQAQDGAAGEANGSSTPKPDKVDKLAKVELISAITWDVFAPPPSNSFKGKLVPRAINRFSKRRKLSIEVHKVAPLTEEIDSAGNSFHPTPYEECVIRILDPADKHKAQEAKREGHQKLRQHLGSHAEFGADDEIDIDEEEASASDSVRKEACIADTSGKHFDGWRPRYRFPCSSVTVESQHKNSVIVLFQIDDLKQDRELIFDTSEDAQQFCAKLDQEREKETTRTKSRLQSALGDMKLDPHERLSLLFEIVSGCNLPIGDFTTSDPYVVCLLGRREVHRTKHIPGTLDPIWTVKTNSLFLLEADSEKLFIEDGVKFLVKDFDQFGKNVTLGLVHVPPKTLYQANGERMEFKLQAVPGKTAEEVPGYLAIRCRRATPYDKEFMEDYGRSARSKEAAKHPKVNNNVIKSITTKYHKVEDGRKKFKVRPGPDPKRMEETEWMTKEEVQEEMMKPSRQWTDAGSGSLGRIFLEVLSAEGLPNMDTGSWLGNLTDAFVSVVFEDVFAKTDVIDDCLNPVWLPWSNRAFILNIGHASSELFLGVFDYDGGFVDPHDLIGRVSVDITNLRPDTEYLLSYNIYPSAQISGREACGKINIRLRLEIPDERKLAMSVLEPPPPTYVNVKKGKDFKVIRQTCFGKHDTERYSMDYLKSFVEELREYQNILMHIEDAAIALFLWRGHYKLKFKGKEIALPLHSFNAFLLAVMLVENPQYYPSFFFASISWLMLAVMGWRRDNPNEWARCYTYIEIAEKVFFGKCRTPPHDIKPFQGFEEAKAALEKWMKRIVDAEERAQRQYIEAQEEEVERQKELEAIGEADTDFSTKVGGGISIDPIKAALYPLQLLLREICIAVRFVRHVIYWEEAFFSFWVTSVCAFLAIACLFVPWFFIIRWTARIVVWTLFGPWMKLVDMFYVSKLKPETVEERLAREKREKELRNLATAQMIKEARLARENTVKMKDMKKLMFGRFAMKVPILKQDRYSDLPLPNSSARPFKSKPMTLAELAMEEAGYNRKRLIGQNLVGDMIPRVETVTFTAAPTGKATASPQKLSKSTPGGGATIKQESTTSAYVYIGSVVAVAGLVTFFGVPILASYTKQLATMIRNFRSR